MDELLQAIASGDIQTIISLISTFFSCGFGAALVAIFLKYKKFKSYSADQMANEISLMVRKREEEIVNKAVEESNKAILNNLDTIAKNQKTIAESLALTLTKDSKAVINNISKIENIDKDIVADVQASIDEEDKEAAAKQEEINNAIQSLEDINTKVDTL